MAIGISLKQSLQGKRRQDWCESMAEGIAFVGASAKELEHGDAS